MPHHVSRFGSPGSGDIDQSSLFNSLVPDAAPGLYPTAGSLAEYARRWVQRWRLRVQIHSNVSSVAKGPGGEGFRLTVQKLNDGASEQPAQVRCRWVVVASGLSRPHLPDLPGLMQHSMSYNEMPGLEQPGFFANKTVAIRKDRSAVHPEPRSFRS